MIEQGAVEMVLLPGKTLPRSVMPLSPVAQPEVSSDVALATVTDATTVLVAPLAGNATTRTSTARSVAERPADRKRAAVISVRLSKLWQCAGGPYQIIDNS